MSAILAIIGVVGIITAIYAYSAFSWGIVLLNFWYWFIIPVFPDLPHITLQDAVGLTLFVALFKDQVIRNQDSDSDGSGYFTQFLLAPWVTLLIGYIVYLFIR